MRGELLQEIHHLGIDERLELLDSIWASIAQDTSALPLPEGHREILESRLQDLTVNPDDSQDWESVRNELLREA